MTCELKLRISLDVKSWSSFSWVSMNIDMEQELDGIGINRNAAMSSGSLYFTPLKCVSGGARATDGSERHKTSSHDLFIYCLEKLARCGSIVFRCWSRYATR
jgi:hypothetical protein